MPLTFIFCPLATVRALEFVLRCRVAVVLLASSCARTTAPDASTKANPADVNFFDQFAFIFFISICEIVELPFALLFFRRLKDSLPQELVRQLRSPVNVVVEECS
jgi:hypothetical protein